MDEQDITPEPAAVEPEAVEPEALAADASDTVAPDADTVADTDTVDADATDTVADEQVIGEPRRSRWRSPVLAGVAAGVIGLGVGAGAVALIGGDHDGGRRDDRQMSVDQMNGQTDGQSRGGMDGHQRGGFDQDGDRQPIMQDGQQMPGQFDQQSQQTGGFMPPQGGGPTMGRTGGS